MTDLFDAWPHLDVELFDALHRGHPKDAVFYRELCRGSSRVLELGCGSGRILDKIAEAAPECIGLDIDPARLMRAQERSRLRAEGDFSPPAWLRASMHSLPFADQTFSHIVIPYNGLFCLLSPEHLTRCLREIRRLLLPNASLCFDVYQAELPDDESFDEGHLEREDEAFFWIEQVRVRDICFDVYEKDLRLSQPGRVDVTYRFVPHAAASHSAACREIEISHWFHSKQRLDALLHEAEFEITDCWGGFSEEPWSEESEMMVYRACPRPTRS